jgi:hypothetical protein
MSAQSEGDELRPEYDFTVEDLRAGVQGKYAAEKPHLLPFPSDGSSRPAPPSENRGSSSRHESV